MGNVNGVAFLNALERVRVIRKDLGRIFGTLDTNHHKQSQRLSDISAFSSSSITTNISDDNRLGASSALRMMETLAQKQERAYERLYHWLQKYLHLHSHEQQNPASAQPDEDYLDEVLSHPFVRRSLNALRNVPAFYSHLLELIAQNRRSEETKRFLLALTVGQEGLPPIEMRAHDSVVYVGDMLAFCFRAFSVEADIARGLFIFNEKIEKEGALIDILVEKETADVLDLCGLGAIVSTWERFKGVHVEGMTMSSFPGLIQDEVESSMKEFYSSLYSPPIPSFENTIKDPTLRKLARTKIAKRVCDRYESIYNAILQPEIGGYDDTSFLGHNPSAVETLFTI